MKNVIHCLNSLHYRYSITENNSRWGKDISYMRKTISELSVGKLLPPFQCSDIHGNTVSLESLKGRVVLLYFYGPGCGSCIKILPSLNRLYSKYGSDKLYILGISCDKKTGYEKYMMLFLKKFNVHWPQTVDFRLFEQYNIFALSTSLLLDKHNKLIFIGRSDKIISSLDYFRGKSLEDIIEVLINS